MKEFNRRKGLGLLQVNKPMRQFLINRAQILYHEAQQFPETRRVATNWICRLFHVAKQAGDTELCRQILRENVPCGAKTEKTA